MSWCIRILFLIVEGSKLNVFFWNQLGLVPNSKKCVLEEKSRILDIYRVRYGPSKSYPKIRQQLKSMKYKLLSLEHLKMVVLLQKELYQPSNNMSIKKIYKAYNRLHMQKLKKSDSKQEAKTLIFKGFLTFSWVHDESSWISTILWTFLISLAYNLTSRTSRKHFSFEL